MRRFFTLSLLFIASVSFAQDGELDPDYGTDGKQINAVTPTVNNNRERIVVLADGSFLQAYAAGSDFGLAKFLADGSPDPSFGGGDGIVTTNFLGNDVATALTVRNDGKIVVVGYTNTTGTDNQFAIARYLADGTLDNTFDADGKLTIPIGTNDVAYAVLASGTSTIVAGSSLNSGTGNFEFALAKVLDNGTLDGSFSGDGKQTTTIGTVATIYDLDMDVTGRIVAAGSAKDQFNVTRFAITRYTNLGVLDASFNGNGILTPNPIGAGNFDAANAVIIQGPTGKIVIGGQSANATDFDFAVARFLPNGTPDNTLDGDGYLITNFASGANDIAYSLNLQKDGKIIVAGTAGAAGSGDFLIARYSDLGIIDGTFNPGGTPGYNQIDFGSTNDIGYDFGFQGTNLLFGGVTGTSLSSARLINASFPLPFYLLNFTAARQGSSVQLKWQTATEIATSKFEILRSTDGRNFSKLGELKAAGESEVVVGYSFNDVRPLPGLSFYRLRMINSDGSVSYSKILVIRSDVNAQLLAFPNPARNTLNLQVNVPAGPVTVQLFDLGGHMVRATQLRSTGTVMSTSLDVSQLATGTYFLKMNNEFVKIIKQ